MPRVAARLRAWGLAALVALTAPMPATAQQGAAFTGRVLSDAGTPVLGATVRADGVVSSATSDSTGRFRLPVPDASARTIRVEATGFRPYAARLSPDRELLVTLQPSVQSLTGVAVVASAYRDDRPSTSLRVPTPLAEIPQNIAVVTSELARAQSALTLSELARNVSGVNQVAPFPTVNFDFNVRGTRSGLSGFRNGMLRPAIALEDDAALIERVEFIKGPAGFMLAQGEPGGLYNVVTKSAIPVRTARIEANTGSFGMYRTALDVGTPLTESGAVSVRFVGALHRNTLAQRRSYNERRTLAPSVRVVVPGGGSVTADYQWSDSESQVGGTTIAAPASDLFGLSPRYSLEEPNVPPMRYVDRYARITWQQPLGASYALNATVGDFTSEQGGGLTYLWFARVRADSLTQVGMPRRIFDERNSARNRLAQLFVSGRSQFLGVEHRVLLGYDAGRVAGRYRFARTGIANQTVPTPGAPLPASALTVSSSDKPFDRDGNRWGAVYLQDDVLLAPWVNVTLAARHTTLRRQLYGTEPDPLEFETDRVWTPRFGVTVRPNGWTNLYALFDQSFLGQQGRLANGDPVLPLRGDNAEGGAHLSLLDGLLGVNAAAFRIRKRNVLNADPENPDFVVARGEVESKGIELDVMGELSPALLVSANYAYTDAKVTKDADPANIGLGNAGTARHMANAWLTWRQLRGAAAGLSVGGGAAAVGDRWASFVVDGARSLPGYTRFDASLGYQRGRYAARLFVENLTDRRYAAFGLWTFQEFFAFNHGAPRSFRLSIDARW